MTTEEVAAFTDDPLAEMRYRLRTPLNRIIGYGDLLLEDGRLRDPGQEDDLRTALANARVILAQLQLRLSPGDGQPQRDKAEGLRSEISTPLQRVRELLAKLEPVSAEQALPDIQRMRAAADELLASLRDGGPVHTEGRRTEIYNIDSHYSHPSEKHTRILVADDDETSCDVFRRQLLRNGHDVVCVLSGAEALEMVSAPHFDLVLLDLVMPEVGGFEVLERMRASGALRHSPVIVMTAFDEMQSAAHCIELGAEDYLLKPVDPVLLRARVRAVLERKRMLDAEARRAMELEQAAQNLTRANESLNRFAYVASHDLQEPLRTVTTTLQLLSGRFAPEMSPQQKELIDLAVDASRRMSDLIRDLLAWSMTTTRERPLKDVDCDDILRAVLDNLRQAIEESGASIQSDPLPSIRFDAALLVQLFQNLIGNAIKYHAARPVEIRVGARRQGDRWLFSVRDNGMGIEPEYLGRIFEPFRRLHGHDLPGTGLGLAICARIVEGLGGRIWAESEPGLGSVFHFTVPASDPPAGGPGESVENRA